MPVKSCREGGKSGYKWGDSGKCYTYTSGDESSRKRAKEKAIKQGRAIQVNKDKGMINNIDFSKIVVSLEEAAKSLSLLTIHAKPNKRRLKIYNLDLLGNIKVIDKSDNKRIIAGYASLAVVDTENEYIPIEVLKAGLSTLISDESYANIMIVHKNIQIGKILDKYGELETHVDDKGLFIVAEIRDDLEIAKKTWEKILNGEIRGFSIGGEIIEDHEECDDNGCVNIIDKINLFEISVCSCPINKDSGFEIVNKCDVSKMLENCNDIMKKKEKDEPNVLKKDEEPCDDCDAEVKADDEEEETPEEEPKDKEPEPEEKPKEEPVKEEKAEDIVEEPVDVLTKTDIIETIKETITETLKSFQKELQEEEGPDEEEKPEEEDKPEEEPPKEEEKSEDNEIVEESDQELEMAVKARDTAIDALNEEIKTLKEQVKNLEETEESPKTSVETKEELKKDIGVIVDKRHGRVYKR